MDDQLRKWSAILFGAPAPRLLILVKKPITQVKNKNVKPPEQNMTAVDGCIKQLLEELSYKLLSQFAINNLTEMCALRYVIFSSILPTDLLE